MPDVVMRKTEEELWAMSSEELSVEVKAATDAYQDVFKIPPVLTSEEIKQRGDYIVLTSRTSLRKSITSQFPPFTPPQLPPIEGVFHDIIPGENRAVFRQIQCLINEMRATGQSIHMGLFGPPSAGKTMTAGKVARALERPYFEGSGAILGGNPTKSLLGILEHLHGKTLDKLFSEIREREGGHELISRIRPSVIFLDEAHEIPKGAEMMLLPVMEKPYTLFHNETYYDFQDVMFILGTTDSALLGRAFRSRVQSFLFVGYSEQSIGEMVHKKYPSVTEQEARLIARAGKLVPRKALNLARAIVNQVTEESGIRDILRDIYEYDDFGLDRADRRLLSVLKESKVVTSPVKLAAARKLIEKQEQGSKVSPVSLANAEALLEQPAAYRPLGIVSLADRLLMSDIRDVEERVNYLESLHLVRRSSRGVQLEETPIP